METFEKKQITRLIGGSNLNVIRPSHGVNNCSICVSGLKDEEMKQTTTTKTSLFACYTDVDMDTELSLSFSPDIDLHSAHSHFCGAGAGLTVQTSISDTDRTGRAGRVGMTGSPLLRLSLSLSVDLGSWGDAAAWYKYCTALMAHNIVVMTVVMMGAALVFAYTPAAISRDAAMRKKAVITTVLALENDLDIMRLQRKLRAHAKARAYVPYEGSKSKFLSKLKMVSHTLPIPFYFTC